MYTEGANQSNLTPSSQVGGEVSSGGGGRGRNGSCFLKIKMVSRAEGTKDLRKLPRRRDIQNAEVKSRHRWMEAYKQGSQ